jgi:hypothetical protein
MTTTREIWRVNETYTWLREPLLARLPDGSLCCAFFTGGRGDGDLRNIVAAVRSDDDGETWSEPEVLVSHPSEACWAPSIYARRDRAYLFWFTSRDRHRYRMVNHILATGEDGRTFSHSRRLNLAFNGERGVDVRRGTRLRDSGILLPIAWKEPIREYDPDTWQDRSKAHRYGNFGWGGVAENNLYCVGVMAPNESFTSFTRHGRVFRETPGAELPCVPFFENQIAELSGGNLVMLMRADMTNRLWRSESRDRGHTWSVPVATDIPNPGSKPLVINLPDGRIALFHNPREKDYDDPRPGAIHRYRTPLEMWVSDDDLRSWYLRETFVAAPAVAQYPDGFCDRRSSKIYVAWEDDRAIYFRVISLDAGRETPPDKDR